MQAENGGACEIGLDGGFPRAHQDRQATEARDQISPMPGPRRRITRNSNDQQRSRLGDPAHFRQAQPERGIMFQHRVAKHDVEAVGPKTVQIVGIRLEDRVASDLARLFEIDSDPFGGFGKSRKHQQRIGTGYCAHFQYRPADSLGPADCVEGRKNRCMHRQHPLLISRRVCNANRRGQAIDNALIELRQRLSSLRPPVIIYNKSHSGSRLLARVLAGQGLFLGAERNQSEDAMPILPVVEACVLRYYPDFVQLWDSRGSEPAQLAAATAQAFERHLAGYDPASGKPWGWKLCETLYALPFFTFLFPQAKVIHLLRDGRDVAWSDHVAPELPFWRKVYFNTDKI